MGGLLIGIIIVLNFIFQTTLLRYFAIGGVIPNTALLLVVSLTLVKGGNKGAVIGFFCGLLPDILYGKAVGINSIALMVIAYLIGQMDDRVLKDSIIVPSIFTALSTALYYGILMLLIFFLKVEVSILNILQPTVIYEIVYNSILVIFIFKLMVRLEKRYNNTFNLRFNKQ